MIMSAIFEKFAKKAPVAVIARASLEYALEPKGIDALFARTAEQQYERKLLFSTLLDLTALVVCDVHPSVRSAYRAMRAEIPVSLTAVYDKLGGVDLSTTEALVAYSAERLGAEIAEMGDAEPWLAGYRIRVLDGNHLAATEHRLEVLRAVGAGPLPGQALVVLEPESGLVVQIVGCEDGHAQERSLLEPILANAGRTHLYLADRNFCTLGFLLGLAARGSHFAIRHHANLPIASAGTLRARGRTATGTVFEQPITLRFGDAELRARRIVLRLDTPTRDGDTEMAIITNLPLEIEANRIADLYRRRWSIESFFARIEHNLQSELPTLGYPKAALFGFGVSLVAANVFAVVHAAMEAAKRATPAVADRPLSEYAIVEELRSMHRGMDVVVDDEEWSVFPAMSPRTFAHRLVEWAASTDWERFHKAIRGPKRPPPKRERFKNKPHVSTARLLAGTDPAEDA